jgi:hypothetical protein
MRSRLSRQLRHLAPPIVLLGTVGAIVASAGGTLGTSAACGCEGEIQNIENTFNTEEKGTSLMGKTTNDLGHAIKIRAEVSDTTGAILKPAGAECKAGTLLVAGASCNLQQDTPVGSHAETEKDNP